MYIQNVCTARKGEGAPQPWGNRGRAGKFTVNCKKAHGAPSERNGTCMHAGKRARVLYDRKNDPFEKHNFVKDPAASAVMRELDKELLDWMGERPTMTVYGR